MKKGMGKLYRLILTLLSPCMLLCSQHAGAMVSVIENNSIYHYPADGIIVTTERFTDEQKERCRRINSDGTITLIFSPERFDGFKDSLIQSIYAYGTITAWRTPIEAYRLPYFSSDSCYYTTLPICDLDRPGNLGNPEIFYEVYYSDPPRTDTLYADPIPKDTGMYVVDKRLNVGEGGVLLMLQDDDIDELSIRISQWTDYAGLAEWELTNTEAQARFANFRCVPGTHNLYRSFHPFYPIISDETAAERVHCVAQCAERTGIRSAISLCGNQANREGAKLPCGEDSMVVHIPDYYREMIHQKHVLNVGLASGSSLSYNNTLWFINHNQYRGWMAELIQFVNESTTPLPIQMHCSLGADRTGSFSAVIAALCGASWEEIAQDYEATRLTRLLYRQRGLIRYTLRQMLGIDPEYVADLQAAMTEYMVADGQISREEIERFIERLQDVAKETSIQENREEATGAQIFYNKRGEIVILKNGVLYNVLGTVLGTRL